MLSARCLRLLPAALIGWVSCIFPPVTVAQETDRETVVRYYQKAFRYTYHRELLDLVLEASQDQYGPYKMRPYPPYGTEVAEARGLQMLDDRTVDVVFLSTTKGREAQFRPIRVPLLRGILGFRLLMIRQSSQEAFNDVETLEALRSHFVAGFNPQWADYDIYAANHILMVDTVRYETLFDMLANRRFDYIPRGVNEVWQELEYFGSIYSNLRLEQQLGLYYPYPVYFFVHPEDDTLAERLARGLEIIGEDGRFEALFWKHHRDAIIRARASERRVFRLENPTLPENTPPVDMSWLFDSDREPEQARPETGPPASSADQTVR